MRWREARLAQQRDLRRVPDLMLQYVPEDILDTQNPVFIVVKGDAAR